MSEAVLQFLGVEMAYGGLRPLRIRQLEVTRGQTFALVGFDRGMAEVFVNLATGGALPDAGDVRIFGESTAAITNADEWLSSLDRFGIVSERAVLLDGLSALQNVAMPLTLDVEPLSDSARAQATRIGEEVGLEPRELEQPVGALSPLARLRVRLGRALALKPLLLLAEHPNASVPDAEVPVFAADYATIVAARGIASVTMTADRTFASAVGQQVLTLEPATGELKAAPGWRRWFAGR